MMILRLIQRGGRLLFLFAALYAVAAVLCLGIVDGGAAIIFIALALIFQDILTTFDATLVVMDYWARFCSLALCAAYA